MSRLQKQIWNPALVAFKPSHLSFAVWMILSPFIYDAANEGDFGFAFGLAVGFSFLQLGYIWGQYHDHWWRFFMENRNAIFTNARNNKPTKRKALTYLIALLAKRIYTPTAITMTMINLYFLDHYFKLEMNWVVEILTSCTLGAITAFFTVRKLQKWGEETARSLSDFSYVLETEPESWK